MSCLIPGFVYYVNRRSEIDATSVLLPVPVAGRVGAIPTPNFLLPNDTGGILPRTIIIRCGRGILGFLNFAGIVGHSRSMPEVGCELYKLITVSGTDREIFLQGQLTQDISLLADAGRLWAAWCNPKGRVIVTIRLIDQGDSIGLLVPESLADDLVRRLTMYRLRADVTFEVSDDWRGIIGDDEADPLTLIRSGVALIDDSNTEAFTPHMLNLDKLGAISFSKGCYTGQEVVARTEHLGKSKRRMMRYTADADGMAVGDKLSDSERNVGEVVNVSGRDLLAVTPVELHDRPLTNGDITVTPQPLPYSL